MTFMDDRTLLFLHIADRQMDKWTDRSFNSKRSWLTYRFLEKFEKGSYKIKEIDDDIIFHCG